MNQYLFHSTIGNITGKTSLNYFLKLVFLKNILNYIYTKMIGIVGNHYGAGCKALEISSPVLLVY